MKSKGLGDSIEKVTKKTGIKKATKWIFDKLGKDCGCDARKAKLNSMFPYKDPECLTEGEYMILKGFFSVVKGSILPSEQKQLLTIHNRVFKTNREQSTCGSCVKGLVDTMKRLYDEYEYERENKKG
jgi:hypothetical protein